MARGRLATGSAREIRKRIAWYVERFHAGDWSAFRKAAGIERTTAAGWKSSKRSTVPDVVQLAQLAERLGISVDWLLLGRGEPLYEPTRPGDAVADRFRAALAQYFGTSERDLEIWVVGDSDAPAHVKRPRAEHFERVLPAGEVVFSLAAELIRPLLRTTLHVVIDREWRRGYMIHAAEEVGHGPDDPFDDGRTARQIEAQMERRCTADVESDQLSLAALAEYAAQLNREGRPPFQLIDYDDDRMPRSAWGTLGPEVHRPRRKE